MNRNMLRGLVLLALSLGACAAPAFPLRASSRWIVDAKGTRVKVCCPPTPLPGHFPCVSHAWLSPPPPYPLPSQFACANWSGGAEKDFVSGGLNLQSRDVIAQVIELCPPSVTPRGCAPLCLPRV